MENFKNSLYKILIDKENFYMKQYYSQYHNKECFVAIREVSGGLYCLLITNEKEEEVDSLECAEFIDGLGKTFNINLVVLSDGNYINTYSRQGLNKIVVNKYDGSIILCDDSCRPIALSINNLLNKNNEEVTKEKNNFIKSYPVTSIIIALNVLMFIVTAFISGNFMDIDTLTLVRFGAKFNPLIKNGEVWRLITCGFLHGGLIHLLCNMYSLFIIGPQIESIYGMRNYIIIYMVSCITSSLLSYYASMSISVGASGAIFGLMGALLAFAILERNRIQKRYISSLVQVIVLNMFIGFSLSNIDNFGHLGGFAGGILFGFCIYGIRRKRLN